MKKVIISDVWYIIDGRDYFVYDWPEDIKECFKNLFNII